MQKRHQPIVLAGFVVALVGLSVLTRFMPHPANCTALGASALLAGAVFPKKWGIFVPVIAMIVSDFFIGFHQLVLFTWGSMALTGLIGTFLRNRPSVLPVAAGSVVASVQFYLITNWAVWQFSPLYAKDFGGLMASYMAGIPFFRNMLVGDLWYSGVLFGLYALAGYMITRRNVLRFPVRS